ncbi:MAG: YbaK/EbsC family protein [Sedimentisphaerales bacterium]|nr:YbaK/EbsC family protein [Sedimentisphaerales bacterium]
MHITEYLKQHDVNYEVHSHRPTFSSQQLAAEEHVSGMIVAKPVIVRADGQYYMCVLPACYKVDLEMLRSLLGADEIQLAEEHEMEKLFPECEVGAEPPFGNMFGLTTIMDESLKTDLFIVCQSGKHDQAIQININDYQELVHPRVLSFSFHLH